MKPEEFKNPLKKTRQIRIIDAGYKNYRGEDWEIQRKKCLERDNYTCRKCQKPAKNSHHIIPYRYSKDNSLKNLITLCKRCHTKEENQYRRLGITNYVRKMILENIERDIKKEGAITVRI